MTELYTKAADQLGSDKAPVRLAGLYALERVAQNNPTQRQTIVNVLCAYLRMPYRLPGEPPADGADEQLVVMHREQVQERGVRLTAQRVLTDHLMPGNPVATFWVGINLDCTGAVLIDFSLANCTVRTAIFRSATFTGKTDFGGATFTGDASFRGAEFQGAIFTGEANFHCAKLTGIAGFRGATFIADANFYEAIFDYADFQEVTFKAYAGFQEVTCTGATFESATFTDEAEFYGATFTGSATFESVTFTSRANFGKATFARGVPDEVVRFLLPAGEDENQ